MAIFVVIPTLKDFAPIEQAITKLVPEVDRYKLPKGEWLVSFEGTSKRLSEKLGVSGEASDAARGAIVLSISGYYGRAPTDVWEWLKQHWDKV